jgi:hypothetical protein
VFLGGAIAKKVPEQKGVQSALGRLEARLRGDETVREADDATQQLGIVKVDQRAQRASAEDDESELSIAVVVRQ